MSLPEWFKVRIPSGKEYINLKNTINKYGLNTVCMSASCPNAGECFSSGNAAFLIMGKNCTRHCRYCGLSGGVPEPFDSEEGRRLAEGISALGLKYAVITSPSRDDLPDRGISGFINLLSAMKGTDCRTEVLVPDFAGVMESAVDRITAENPFVFNHNLECAGPVFRKARPEGSYELSLNLLSRASGRCRHVKSGLMAGLGETFRDIEDSLKDLRSAGVSIVTIGQYLRPGKNCLPVEKFYTPEEFSELRQAALNMGFDYVASGPFVRSSYHAVDYFSVQPAISSAAS